jgi:hypothetical protein
MQQRQNGASQQLSAARAGFSVRTGYRIEKGTHQPKAGQLRSHRTRVDPLIAVWESELLPLLRDFPTLQPITLWEHLQDLYPGQYPQAVMRTLQRRVQLWKACEGPPKEVMFRQVHPPGGQGLSDFTQLDGVVITVAGQPFKHLLYHFRLAYSGWNYIQVVQGGESFAALSEGLQNALTELGGCPKEHRTDSLSAAYRNLESDAVEDLTEAYRALCAHYGMAPSRNNRGVAHENGSIEAPHGHFKRRLSQALILRNSNDFDSVAAYQTFIAGVVARLNALHQSEIALERPALLALPCERQAEYQVVLTGVSSGSTICVRCILYTVPSRLIGTRLRIHLYQDRLVCLVSNQQVAELPRVYANAKSGKRRAHAVNYRHVIDSLYKKPGAFAHCQYRDELLPNEQWRSLWQQMVQQHDLQSAGKLMVNALYLAAKLDREHSIAVWLAHELDERTLTLRGLRQQFEPPVTLTVHTNHFIQHSLLDYDQLLNAQGRYLA